MMKTSTATSVYVNYAIEETVRHIAEAGYDGVDLWGGRPHVYRRDLSEDRLKKLRDLLNELGLAVPSLMPAFFRYPHSLSNPNEIVRKDSLDYMALCADNAAALGAEILLIVPGRSLHWQSLEDAWQRMVDSVCSVCEYTAQYDLKLAIEPVNRYVSDLVNTAADARRMIAQVTNARLGMVLDTGHIHLSAEPPLSAIATAGDRLFQVHINDNDGRHQQNLVLGRGTFDFKNFLVALRQAGYDGFLTAELAWEYTLDPDPAVRETAGLLRQIIQ